MRSRLAPRVATLQDTHGRRACMHNCAQLPCLACMHGTACVGGARRPRPVAGPSGGRKPGSLYRGDPRAIQGESRCIPRPVFVTSRRARAIQGWRPHTKFGRSAVAGPPREVGAALACSPVTPPSPGSAPRPRAHIYTIYYILYIKLYRMLYG